jgi:hypothetical protein
MTALAELKRRLRPGQVYRRKDLARWSNAVDRHVRALVDEGRLEKAGPGLYMVPRTTRFGPAPPKTEKLVESFLEDDRFLVVSPSAYTGLGVGATQLYNEPVVYNRKRHGRFTLDGRTYDFRRRASVPGKLTRDPVFRHAEPLGCLGDEAAPPIDRGRRRRPGEEEEGCREGEAS